MPHPALLRSLLLATAVAAGLASCGGSSSETPWPIEPRHSVLDPVGESAPPPSLLEERPDGGAPVRPRK